VVHNGKFSDYRNQQTNDMFTADKITDDENIDSLYKLSYGTAVDEWYNVLCIKRSNCKCPII